jgi:hypothetical protein
MFQLTQEESAALRFQIETSKPGRGGRRYRPHVFTEHGVAMLSSVLNSRRAVQVNILIMRTFAKLREMLAANTDLARKLGDLEKKYRAHDVQIKAVFDALRRLTEGPAPKPRRIGFAAEPAP